MNLSFEEKNFLKWSDGLFAKYVWNDNNNYSIYFYSAISSELKLCSGALVTTLVI